MGNGYTQNEINFIIIISVVMVVIVTMTIVISILLSRRRNRQLETFTNGYTLTTEITDVWSVSGHYNPIDL